MNRIDEATWIAYIYGELDQAESDKVKRYLAEHPEALQHLQAMEQVRSVLQGMEDKEVIPPPVIMDNGTKGPGFWQAPYFKTILSIAASFLLILVAAKMLDVRIDYRDSALSIRFGPSATQPVKETEQLTPTQVQEMIGTALNKNNEQLVASWSAHEEKLNQTIQAALKSDARRMDNLMAQAADATKEQVRSYVANLQQDNLQLVQDYLQLSASQQKEYVQNLLVDFTKYLQEQRNQDLQFFQARMTNIEKNTDQFKEQTEQILGSIISNAGVTNKKNNY